MSWQLPCPLTFCMQGKGYRLVNLSCEGLLHSQDRDTAISLRRCLTYLPLVDGLRLQFKLVLEEVLGNVHQHVTIISTPCLLFGIWQHLRGHDSDIYFRKREQLGSSEHH